jgi:Fe2+ transport system protein FeoA
MGIIKDEIIEVERNSGVGPIQIKVKGTHIALGRGISSKILVEVESE